MSTKPQPDLGSPESAASDAAVAARRQAILRGLGKGGAALVALSPMASHATRSFKLSNPPLAGGFGYCSVSGFQSAVVSGSPDTIPQCAAFAPSFFATVTKVTYSTLTSPAAVDVAGLLSALKGRYGLSEGALTEGDISSTLLATIPQKLLIAAAKVVIVPDGTIGGTEIKATSNFPTTIIATGPFNGTGLFTASSDVRTLLEVLSDGIGAESTNANCYFLASYLTVMRGGATLPGSVDATYILARYDAAGFTTSTDEGKFFKALANRTS